jgi:pilus assembly protein Flp/PilA
MRRFIGRFLRNQDGATAIEYGLICGLIFVAILTGLTALGGANGALYAKLQRVVTGLGG